MKYTLSPWLVLSFIFYFFLSLSLRDGGFPVTWTPGSPLLILSLGHHISFSFSVTIFHFFSPSLCPWLPVSLLSLYASLSLLFLWRFLSLLSVCLQCVCDRAAWQEGRQADGHWDLEWLRSGASSAHGEHVFPTSVKCQRTPIHCLNPQCWLHVLRKGEHQAFERTCVGLTRTILQLLKQYV